MSLWVVGNWKMNQQLNDIDVFFRDWDSPYKEVFVGIAPQYIHIPELNKRKNFLLGSQNISSANKGAFTGEVSATALKEVGVDFTLLGHSERREHFKESNEELRKKVEMAIENSIGVVFCVGETLAERKKNQSYNRVSEQLSLFSKDLNLASLPFFLIAYEPVWAIGTGEVASLDQIHDMHSHIKKECSLFMDNDVPILYGGSVNPKNAKEIFSLPLVDGGLVGGASLKSASFIELINIAHDLSIDTHHS